METKSTVDNVSHLLCNKGFVNSMRVDVDGQRGGLWVGWKSNLVISVQYRSKHLILLSIRDDFNLDWHLALIFGSPYLGERAAVSNSISAILGDLYGPLLCIGDFNQILSFANRLGSPITYILGLSLFRKFLFNLSLIELQSWGPHFTLTNNRSGIDCTFERLDRAFCNGEWSSLNFNVSVTNLPIHGSDHASILLCTSQARIVRKRPFRFENFWTLHDDCQAVIQSSWQEVFQGSPMFVIANKLRITMHRLLSWSREGIGDLAGHISTTRSLLNDLAQEAAVCNQLKNLLEQEEVYGVQRAKSRFLALGDKNTSYFHKIPKVKRQGSCIKGIYNDQGLWIDKEDVIHRVFLAHFSSAYQEPNTSVNVENWDGWDYFDKRLSSDHQNWLNRVFRAHEVRKAVFQIGDSKAPAPDGFSRCFFPKILGYCGCFHKLYSPFILEL